jgi:hypothetical protein
MVLTRVDNDLLTRVGPGTLGGELLRLYWMPIDVDEQQQRGLHPMGVIRDPDHPMLDANIDESTKVEDGDRPVGICAPTAY